MDFAQLSVRAFALRSALAVAVTTTLLAACGGDSGVDGPVSESPAPTTQLALGAISGFGSVYIDGVRYDDSETETVIEDAEGNRIATRLELGQRVRALHDGQGKASRLVVEAAVIGAITEIDTSAGTLTVAAQRIRVITDPALGPKTRFGGGYDSLAGAMQSDDVEVHGSPVYDSVAQRYEIRATRVSKLDSRSHYRVSGTASAVATDRFELNGLTVAYTTDVIRPAGASITEGAGVVVFGTELAGTDLTATVVRVLKSDAAAPAARTQVALGGFISAWDESARSLTVDGQSVRLGSITPSPANAVVQVGAYVKVTGVMAADGVVDASRLDIRTLAEDDALAVIRLAGEVTDRVDDTSFLVRGVPVDAGGVTPAASCPAPLIDGTQVQIKAKAQADTDVVLATEIQCPAAPARRPREVADTSLAWPVSATTRTFTMTDARTNEPVTVRWDDKTAFLGLPRPGSVDAATQILRSIVVEGHQEGDVVVARVVRDVATPAGRRDSERFRRGPDGGVKPHSWLTYRDKGRP